MCHPLLSRQATLSRGWGGGWPRVFSLVAEEGISCISLRTLGGIAGIGCYVGWLASSPPPGGYCCRRAARTMTSPCCLFKFCTPPRGASAAGPNYEGAMQNTARWGGLASKSALETTWGETGQPAGGTTAPAVKRKVFAAKPTLLLKAGEWGACRPAGKAPRQRQARLQADSDCSDC